MVGASGAIAFNLCGQLAFADRRTNEQVAEAGLAPSLIALALDFTLLCVATYRSLLELSRACRLY